MARRIRFAIRRASPGMGAQRLTDQIGTAAVQPLLEQAVGQQIGGDHDAGTVGASLRPCPGYRLMQLRISDGRECQANS